jgi:ribonuclease Z
VIKKLFTILIKYPGKTKYINDAADKRRSMVEVTMIGTSGSVPTVDRGMPALSIKYGPELLLFDCGEGTQRQMMKYRLGFGSINAIFISHSHLDHYVGLFGLLETLHLSSPSPKPLKLFLPAHMEDIFSERHKFLEVHPIKKGEIYKGRDFTVSAFPVKHGRGTYGFVFSENEKIKFHEKKAKGLGIQGRLFSQIQKKGSIIIDNKEIKLEDVTWREPGKKVVYSGDTSYSTTTVEAAENADILIHEGTFDSSRSDEAVARKHSTAEVAASVAAEANVKQLVLTHISPRYSDETKLLLKEAKKIFKNTVIAEDGMKIKL